MPFVLSIALLSLLGSQDTLPSAHDPYFGPIRTLRLVSRDGREVIDDFNRASGHPRLFAVLSPTADDSGDLAFELRRLLAVYSKTDFKVSVIWSTTAMSDSRRRALAATSILSDPRVEHFFDPAKVLPRILGLRFSVPDRALWTGVAFFGPGDSWGDLPPRPWRRTADPSQLEALFASIQSGVFK